MITGGNSASPGGAGTMSVQCSSDLMTIFWAKLNITVSAVSGGWNAQV